jgi:hypothetical protein
LIIVRLACFWAFSTLLHDGGTALDLHGAVDEITACLFLCHD